MKKTIKLLDGSLSYPLEKKGYNLNTKLWTAHALINNPKEILRIHKDYINSGTDFISTSTYQASVRGLLDYGYNISKIEKIFNNSVELAKKAIDETSSKNKISIIGSFGPFAAYLADGSEYNGNYKFSDNNILQFHSENIDIINKLNLDIILYETIPNLREAKILSKIIDKINKEIWISFTCNDKLELRDGSSLKKACKIFSSIYNISTIGINCVQPHLISDAIKLLKKESTKKILVYPNSGEKFDHKTKTWNGKKLFNKKMIKEWIKLSPDVIGGCCRIDASVIKKMRKYINLA